MRDVTRILSAIEKGDAKAADELLPLVYEELRLLAVQKMANEQPGQTLQATALVHEAYLRLAGSESQHWDSRGHFYVAAAEAMRRILIDNARRKKSLRRGGAHKRVEFDTAILKSEKSDEKDALIALDEALQKLTESDPVKADLVKLRYFAGLTIEEAAGILGISTATADRYWDYSKSWLRVEISPDNKSIKN